MNAVPDETSASTPPPETPEATEPVCNDAPQAEPEAAETPQPPADEPAVFGPPFALPDEIGQMVADIKTRLDEIASRESEIERRERQLESLQEQRAVRELQQEAGQRELEQLSRRLREREQAAQERRAKHRQKLVERYASIREREKDLKQRIQRARDEITRQRGELRNQRDALTRGAALSDKRRAELDAREAELEDRHRELVARAARLERNNAELETRTAECEALVAEMQARAAESDRQQSELDAQRAEIEREREQLEQTARDLEQRSETLLRRQQELEQARRDSQHNQRQRARQIEDTDARRRILQQERAALQERELRLESREEQLRQRAAELAAGEQKLAGRAAALARQPASAAELQREAAGVGLAKGGHEQAGAGRRIRTLRAGGLATMVGVVAGLAWFVWEQPAYRSAAQIRIISENPSPERAIGQHLASLLTPGLIAEALREPDLAEAWDSGLADGRVRVAPLVDRTALELGVTTPDRELSRRLAGAAFEAYSKHLERRPVIWRSSEPVVDAQRRARLVGELQAARQRRRETRQALPGLPQVADRERLLAESQQQAVEFEHLRERLRAARRDWATLHGQEVPRAAVEPEAIHQALARDAVYQQDLKEFQAQARTYQTELAVAMVLALEPLRTLRASLQALRNALEEQRTLQPPSAISATLEACSTDIVKFHERLASLLQSWERWREKLERLEVEQDVVELVGLQTQAADAARDLLESARDLHGLVLARVDGLSGGEGAGTRAVVVASVLRGDLIKLNEDIAALAEAVAAVDLTANFRLEAHDRQLRGLRSRLLRRQNVLRQKVQAQAQRRAEEQHAYHLEERGARVRRLEQEREALIAAQAETLSLLLTINDGVLERRDLEAQLRRAGADITRLEAQLAEWDRRAKRSGGLPDRVELVGVRHEQMAGVHRLRNAAMAAGGAFFGVWMVVALVTGGKPRGHRGAEQHPNTTDLSDSETVSAGAV